MASGKFSLVRLRLDQDKPGDKGGIVLDVTLESPFVLRGGVEPSENVLTIPWTEFDRLNNDGHPSGLGRTGTLECWFGSGPVNNRDPDYFFKRLTIVHVEPAEYGSPMPQAGQAAVRRIIKYKLVVADLRHRFISPRGGHLRLGDVNKEGATKLRFNSELITLCMKEMGYTKPGEDHFVSTEADLRPRIRNLEWRGNHAPTELAKILDRLQMVFALRADGFVTIEATGTGDVPAIPDAQRLPDIELPRVDRRAKNVIFVSDPNAIVNTATLEGPSDDTWHFVATNDAQEWVTIEEAVREHTGESPEEVMRNNFKNIPASARDRMRTQLYRFIRLNEEKHPYSILRRVWRGPGNERFHTIEAKRAVQEESGNFKNSTEFVQCTPTHLYRANKNAPASILQTGEILGKMKPEQSGKTAAWLDHFIALVPGDLRVTFAHEAVEVDGTGKPVLDVSSFPRPKFFEVGYTTRNRAIVKLTADEVLNARLDLENTFEVKKPEWTLYQVNGDSVNREELEGEALKLATRYLATSDDPPVLMTGMGFFQAELSGKVAEIRLQQQTPRIDCLINTWWLPVGAVRLDEYKKKKGGGDERFAEQHFTQSDRIAAGAEGSGQPAVPLMPSVQSSLVMGSYLLRLDAASNGGKYLATVMGGRSTAIPESNLSMPEGLVPGQQVLAINAEEDAQPTHLLPVPSYVCAVDHGQKDQNLRVLSIVGLRYRKNAPLTLADDDSWTRDQVTDAAAKGDTPFTVPLDGRVVWDGNVLKQRTRVMHVDAGGRIFMITASDLVTIDTPEDCVIP